MSQENVEIVQKSSPRWHEATRRDCERVRSIADGPRRGARAGGGGIRTLEPPIRRPTVFETAAYAALCLQIGGWAPRARLYARQSGGESAAPAGATCRRALPVFVLCGSGTLEERPSAGGRHRKDPALVPNEASATAIH
jgi:hypothetical protein